MESGLQGKLKGTPATQTRRDVCTVCVCRHWVYWSPCAAAPGVSRCELQLTGGFARHKRPGHGEKRVKDAIFRASRRVAHAHYRSRLMGLDPLNSLSHPSATEYLPALQHQQTPSLTDLILKEAGKQETTS